MGQRYTPIERVGVYVPGTPTFPSTVLMNVVPAVLAGVSEIVMDTPRPGTAASPTRRWPRPTAAGHPGDPSGGAQAVAAWPTARRACPGWTRSWAPADIYVATAKRKVFGLVDIDMIAGPSEILVLADGGCDPRWVAADLLSQAEHDRLASAVLVTDSPRWPRPCRRSWRSSWIPLPRREVARAALERNGRIVLLDDLDRAAEAANEIAPEHLELCVDDPFALLGNDIRNAGSVFWAAAPRGPGRLLCRPQPHAAHRGTARFSSPLGVDDFVKRSSFLYYPPQALAPGGAGASRPLPSGGAARPRPLRDHPLRRNKKGRPMT
jgi:histidinol dehydrogenase